MVIDMSNSIKLCKDIINKLAKENCDHNWKYRYEQYFGGLQYVCRCTKCQ